MNFLNELNEKQLETGIDFRVESVTVNGDVYSSWNDALDSIYENFITDKA